MKKNLLTAAAITMGAFLSTGSDAQTMYGVTNANTIFSMSNVNSPSSISGPYNVTGMASGQAIIGIHSRPSNNRWYIVGYDSLTQMAELYTVVNSGSSYTATPVSGTLTNMNLGTTNNAAFSFVSTSDNMIRVIGRNGYSYMMNADNGSMIGSGNTGGLSYAGGDLLSGTLNSMTATSFTNNFYGSDASQEVGYDAVNNVLVNFDAANYGNSWNNASSTMHSIGLTTGILLQSTGSMGMDTWYDTLTHSNMIYLTGNTLLSGSHLYSHNMNGTGGTLTDLGAIGNGSLIVRGIGFASNRDSSSAVTGHLMTALSLNMRNLLWFDANRPRNIRRTVALNGMTSGQTMVGIDYSSTGTLYGLGYNSGSHTYQLYTIDSATGHATAVNNTAGSLNLGTDDGSGNYVHSGFRFIPTLANRIRVMGNNGSTNSQIDATTGLVVATDTAMSYITGDANFGAASNITTMAYTGYNGDASTQMFGYDANTGKMVTFNLGNSASGYGNGSSGYASTGLDLGATLNLYAHNNGYNNSAMNIMYDQSTNANVGFITSNFNGDSSNSMLNYSVLYDMSGMLSGYNKTTVPGPTQIGGIGYGVPVKDITMKRPYTPGSTTGVAINALNNGLLVYPNPVQSTTRIVLTTVPVSAVNVDVINMNGDVTRSFIYAPGTYNLDVDMSSLPTGMYSVRVYGKDTDFRNLKVMKN